MTSLKTSGSVKVKKNIQNILSVCKKNYIKYIRIKEYQRHYTKIYQYLTFLIKMIKKYLHTEYKT